ncbi:MAG: hypothetical protein IJV40_01490, partial [Oscillospiraceae bacterium]|nr:hypothetical protein [Oscillospiraceae bacterium]
GIDNGNTADRQTGIDNGNTADRQTGIDNGNTADSQTEIDNGSTTDSETEINRVSLIDNETRTDIESSIGSGNGIDSGNVTDSANVTNDVFVDNSLGTENKTDTIDQYEDTNDITEETGKAQRGATNNNPEINPEEPTPTSPNTGQAEMANISTSAKDLSKALGELKDDISNLIDDLNSLTVTMDELKEQTVILESAINEADIQIPSSLVPNVDDLLTQFENIELDENLIDSLYRIIGSENIEINDIEGLIEQLRKAIIAIDELQSELDSVASSSYHTDDMSREEQNALIDYYNEFLSRYIVYNLEIQAAETAIESAQPAIEESINNVYSLSDALDNYLSNAQNQMNNNLGYISQDSLDEIAAQIEEGEAALADGEAQLLAEKEKQQKKAEELDREKRSLDRQEKELQLSAKQAETQKEREDREKSIRLALLSRPEIKEGTESGADLLTASGSWLSALTKQTEENYRDRFDASMLMFLCAILALIGALASFGTGPNRVLVVLATLLCQAFAISAAVLLYRMGRGISWSSAVTAAIATAELACVLPEFTPKPASKPARGPGQTDAAKLTPKPGQKAMVRPVWRSKPKTVTKPVQEPAQKQATEPKQ